MIWGQVLVGALSFLGVRLYTELLNSSEFGTAMLLMGGIAFIDGLSGMAFNQTLLAQSSKISDRQSRYSYAVGLFFSYSNALLRVGAGVGAAALTLALMDYLSLRWVIALVLIFPYLVSECAKFAITSQLTIEKKYSKLSIWTSCEAFIGLLVSSTLLVLTTSDAITFITSYFLARVISSAAGIWLFGEHGNVFKNYDKTSREKVREALKYAAPVALMAPLGWVSAFLDRYVLGVMLGSGAVGSYVAATSLLSRPYALLSSFFSTYFRPKIYQQNDPICGGGMEGLKKIVLIWACWALLLGCLGACLVSFFGDWISLAFLARAYREEAVQIMPLFAASLVFSIMTHAPDNALLAAGMSKPLLRLQVVMSILSLIAIPIGVALSGLLGGLYAKFGCEAAKFIATLIWARWLLSRSVR